MTTRQKFTRSIFTALILLVFSSAAVARDAAEWHDWPTGDRIEIGAGFFAPDLDTAIIVTDANDIVGTGISFENNLGLDDSKSTALVSADWRFAKKHSVGFRYFDLQRSASTSGGSVAIAIGEEVFDLALPIASFFDITANEINYSYSILFDEKMELSAGLGISIQDLEFGIQGTESSPNPGEIINSTLNSTAPLPTLNFGFNYAFSDKWLFQSTLGWLAIELDLGADEDLSGQIINANVGVMWKTFKNVGFFARYQIFDVDVDYVDSDIKFAIDYDYKGPVLGVSANF